MIGESPPSSFVPADDNLFAPVAHSGIWLLLGVLAVAASVALLWWGIRTAPAVAAERAAQLSAKQRYLAEIDDLAGRFARHELDARDLHHRLSTTVRRFAADYGAPGALAMTPAILREVGHASVAAVVAGYQPPQFMEQTECDPERSLASARSLIDDFAEWARSGRGAL